MDTGRCLSAPCLPSKVYIMQPSRFLRVHFHCNFSIHREEGSASEQDRDWFARTGSD